MMAARAVPRTQVTPLQRLGFFACLAYVFFLHSRVLDFRFGSLHLPLLMAVIGLSMIALTGGLVRPFKHRVGTLLVLLTCWMMLAVPFSIWKGGSVFFFQSWLNSLLVYPLVAALVLELSQLRHILYTIVFAILVLSVLALITGSMETGRLTLPQGKFSNPNDVAQVLLLALPLCGFVVLRPGASMLIRAMGVLAALPMLATFSKTGSRSGFVGLAAIMLGIFIYARFRTRILMASAAVLLAVVALGVLPQSLRERYFTFFSFEDSESSVTLTGENADPSRKILEYAASSAESRWVLLRDSLILTLRHPFLGVGPGQYRVAQNELAVARGLPRGNWQPPHNTYTELSSEAGIPALVLYVLALIACFRALSLPGAVRGLALIRSSESAYASVCLRLALVGYVSSGLFNSLTYQPEFEVLAGLAVAFHGIVRAEPVPPAPPQAARPKPQGIRAGRPALRGMARP